MIVKVDTDLIAQNILFLQQYGDFMCVLKSNAYGIGLEKVSKICLDMNYKIFCVRDYQEALAIKKIDPNVEIIVLYGLENVEYLPGIYPAVISIEQLEEAKRRKIEYWIHFDVGINRTGIKEKIYDKDAIGVMAHFSYSKEYEIIRFNIEYQNAKDIFSMYSCRKSLAKTSCIPLVQKNEYLNRAGIGLYIGKHIAIKAYAIVIDVKIVKRGEYIGYDAMYIAQKDIKIAIVDCGYAHGFNMNSIYINNVLCYVVGKISMELSIFDVSDIDVKVGDIAEVRDFTHSDIYNITTNNHIQYSY